MSLENRARYTANPEYLGESLTLSINAEKNQHDKLQQYLIRVGNSGLDFVYFKNYPDTLWMHFTPEHSLGSRQIDDLTQRKYTTIYCSAFYEFLLFWQNTNFFSPNPKPAMIEGYTNPRMHHFRQNLFNQEEEIYETHGELGDSFDYCMDLGKVIQHPDLIQRLKRFHDRAKTENFIMKA